ncbi:type II secretion system F family protein, partial [Halorhodospira neutriphila]
MSRLRWQGVDSRGRRLCGACYADSAAALRAALEQRGIAALRVHRELAPARRPRGGAARRAAALQRLAAVLTTGAPLDQALRTVAAQESDPLLRRCLRRARGAIESGTALAPA